jgi:ketosteroid isomerase-like protein
LSLTIRHFTRRLPRRAIMLAVAGLAVATAAGAAPARKATPKTSEQAVAAAVANFYIALNAMFTGNGQPMMAAWSHGKDVTYMGPDGHYLIGWDQIGPTWNAQAARKLGGHVDAQQLHSVVGTDLAVVNCIESGENIVDGKAETVRLRATNVFRKEAGGWKLIAHQTDLLGYMNKPK